MFGLGFRLTAYSDRRSRRGALTSLVALAAAAIIVAGCSSSATQAPSATEASTAPSPTAEPTLAPTPTEAPSPTARPSGQVVAYDVLKSMAKQVEPAADDGAGAGAQIDAFAFDLLTRLDADGNLCYSPASIALALGMVRAGARGSTATQMDAVLHNFGATGQDAEIAALLAQLRGQTYYVDADGVPLEPGATPDPSQPNPVLQLIVSDQLFSQKGMTVDPAYLDRLAAAYDAGVGQLDFQNDPESGRLTINKWANDNTKGRIPNVLQPGDVTSDTRIALANAIYLKASWQDKFDPADTKPGQFTTSAGAKVSVPMMSQEFPRNYAAGTGYRAVEVPLEMVSTLSVVFLVPDDMASFQSQLTASKFDSILGSMKTYDVSFWLPKYSIESRMDVASVLSAMGMPDVFDPSNADLSGITTDEKLFIQQVVHQANLDVDEEGVTAAAVTVALGLGGAGEPPPHVDFKVDKPFLYFIRDRQSGTILFMGRVTDPTTK